MESAPLISPKDVLYVLLAIIGFFLLVSFLGFYQVVHPSKIVSAITPRDLGLSYEAVRFETENGLMLSGWFIPATGRETKKTIVLLHGYPADKGNVLPLTAFLAEEYNLFLFDFRAHGESDGFFTTVGALESEDLQAALRYLSEERGIESVGVWGFSMGGAVALMTAAESPSIRAVVADSSYGDLQQMTKQLYLIPRAEVIFGPFMRLWGSAIFQVDINDVSPRTAAESLRIPTLIIHSKDDQVIPFDQALQLEEALQENARAEFWFYEGLPHGAASSEYENRLRDFFERAY